MTIAVEWEVKHQINQPTSLVLIRVIVCKWEILPIMFYTFVTELWPMILFSAQYLYYTARKLGCSQIL